jgi:hypothetical protein
VRRPEYIDRVDFLLDGYVKAAAGHEQMGDLAGARERHRLIAQLKQPRSEMLLLAEAEPKAAGHQVGDRRRRYCRQRWLNMRAPGGADPFAHLKRQATERADLTVE